MSVSIPTGALPKSRYCYLIAAGLGIALIIIIFTFYPGLKDDYGNYRVNKAAKYEAIDQDISGKFDDGSVYSISLPKSFIVEDNLVGGGATYDHRVAGRNIAAVIIDNYKFSQKDLQGISMNDFVDILQDDASGYIGGLKDSSSVYKDAVFDHKFKEVSPGRLVINFHKNKPDSDYSIKGILVLIIKDHSFYRANISDLQVYDKHNPSFLTDVGKSFQVK